MIRQWYGYNIFPWSKVFAPRDRKMSQKLSQPTSQSKSKAGSSYGNVLYYFITLN